MKNSVFILVLSLLQVSFSSGQQDNLLANQEKTQNNQDRFEELAKRYKSFQEKYYAEKPDQNEDQFKRFLQQHPMNSMVQEFLALERQSRGSKTGFSCLYHLVLSAGSVSGVDYPVTKGKVAALRILGDHYRDYPDVDLSFRYLFSGARVPETKAFLRKLIKGSKRKYVQASAMYELANYLAQEANFYSIANSQLQVIDRKVKANEPMIKHFESLLSDLKNVSIERNREESRALIKQIKSDYKEELMPPRVATRTPGIISVKRGEMDELLKSKRERVVDRLISVQFELNHGIGQRPPEIDGQDAKGKPMRLSEFQGKVVVVMFSFKGCGPCEAMYPDNRSLIKELAEEPFEFLGVQGDEKIETVRETIDSGDVSWRVWWDGKDKQISNQWNIRGWPTTYVIDQKGIIRFRDLRGKELATAVRLLLKK